MYNTIQYDNIIQYSLIIHTHLYYNTRNSSKRSRKIKKSRWNSIKRFWLCTVRRRCRRNVRLWSAKIYKSTWIRIWYFSRIASKKNILSYLSSFSFFFLFSFDLFFVLFYFILLHHVFIQKCFFILYDLLSPYNYVIMVTINSITSDKKKGLHSND